MSNGQSPSEKEAMVQWGAMNEEIRLCEERARQAILGITTILRTKGVRRTPSERYPRTDLGWMFDEDVKLRAREEFAYGGFFQHKYGFMHVLTSDDIDTLFKVPEYTTLLFWVPEWTGEHMLALRFTGTALRHCAFLDAAGEGERVLHWDRLQEIAYALFQVVMGAVQDPLFPGQTMSYGAMVATTLGSLKGTVRGLEEAERKGVSPEVRTVLDQFWRVLDRLFPPKKPK